MYAICIVAQNQAAPTAARLSGGNEAMIYELRMYHAAPGRMDDIAARMRDRVPAVFTEHGFPQPLGQWRATAGSKLPLYVWMLAWPDSETRARAFAALYADAKWMNIRAETNGPRETVLSYDISFMHDTPAGQVARRIHKDGTGHVGGLHEMRVHQIYPGRLAQANSVLSGTDLPALKEAGATTLGVFEIQSGLVTPGFVHFLAWEDFEARRRGLAQYDANPEVQAARTAEADELKTHVVGRHDAWLLEPTDFGRPQHGFGIDA
jgi:hypothetical protein